MSGFSSRDVGLYRDALTLHQQYGARAPATRLGKAYDELGAAVAQRLKDYRWRSIYTELSDAWNAQEPLPQHPIVIAELSADWEPS